MTLNPFRRAHFCAHDDTERPACVLCGRCLEVCPLFAATDAEELSPKAKHHLLRALRDNAAGLSAKPASELAGICLSCGKCEKACPQDLCVPELLGNLRAKHPGWEGYVWKAWVEGARTLWPAASALAKAGSGVFRQGRLGQTLSGLAALDKASDLSPWLVLEQVEPVGRGRNVALFAGCVAEHGRTSWRAKALGLLERLDFRAVTPEFACCGCTLGHAGLKADQRRMQLHNIEAWRGAGRPELVSFCATCRCGLRSYASFDLGWEPGEAELWREKQRSLADFLASARFSLLDFAPTKVHYHKPCHGSGANFDGDMLQKALGDRFSFVTRPNLCCGFGGMLKLAAPAVSAQVAGQAWDVYAPAPGDQLLTGCSGCVVQLSSTAPQGVQAGHWLEILAL